MSKKICLTVSVFLLLSLWPLPAAETGDVSTLQEFKQRVPVTLILPDLVLEKIELETKPQGTTHKIVTVRYTVYNDSKADSFCCPTVAGRNAWNENGAYNSLYPIRVEGRNLPNGIFSPLTNGGKVHSVTKGNERQVGTATETILLRARREYRVILDYGNWIREKNENNNQKTKQ
jgi:hypothetical protein